MSLKWVEKVKWVYNKNEAKNVGMRFLWCEVNDDYNNGMNGIDIADQFWGMSHIDQWMRKWRWWWAIWIWGVQLLLVNAYILCKTTQLIMWKKDKKSIMSHDDFWHQIALAWLLGNDGSSTNNQPVKMWKFQDSTAFDCSTTSTKARRVNNSALDPHSGVLWRWLDDDAHYPIPLPDAKCPCHSLCWWVQKTMEQKNRLNVSYCVKCNVSLCVLCFKPFHTISGVKELKLQVRNNMEGWDHRSGHMIQQKKLKVQKLNTQ